MDEIISFIDILNPRKKNTYYLQDDVKLNFITPAFLVEWL